MAHLALGPNDGLYYLHHPPADASGRTFVFVNALTGDTGTWENAVAPALRDAGHGTLSFNFRGQKDSPFSAGTALESDLIVDDFRRLLAETVPSRPVFVGLSIGGLFALRAWLAGGAADAIVLVNTLRRPGPRLDWINDALVRCAEIGGLDLFRDLYLPLLFGPEWQRANRRNFLKDAPYTPLAPDSGHMNLLRHAGAADWDVPYEDIALPVLVLTGLEDRVFLDLADVADLFARLPDARRVDFAGIGHLIPAEAPVPFTEELLRFAERL